MGFCHALYNCPAPPGASWGEEPKSTMALRGPLPHTTYTRISLRTLGGIDYFCGHTQQNARQSPLHERYLLAIPRTSLLPIPTFL